MSVLESMRQALIDGKHEEVGKLTQAALDDGLKPADILDDGLLAGMEVISGRFRKHEIFLPQVLMAARAMYAGLDLIKPQLEEGAEGRRGTVVIGTVEGDLHDIGKNLVGILLRGAGFNVIDLGNNVAPDVFVAAVKEHQAQVVGMSALLTTTMPGMAKVIAALQEAGLRDTKTVIGGAPVSDGYAAEIGADAYGFDAAKAAAILVEWTT